MKPLRAWLLALPPSLLELGSYDNYRLQQASPSPEYSCHLLPFSYQQNRILFLFSVLLS